MKGFIVLALACSLWAARPAAAGADTYTVDPSHSQVLFRVKHLGISNFYGRFNRVSGTFTFDEGAPTKSALSIEIDAQSVFTADKKRDEHLKSPDFFNVKQFPTIRFTSESVEVLKNGNYQITGKMTLLGTAKPVSVEMQKVGQGKDPWGGERIGFEGTFTFRRTEFGMKYSTGALGDEVKVIISIEGIRK